ncbi:hypothetical protein [Klebsiella aerogenes]|uniref:hypothetical protein n=1 Tax=Klebsiella aerogenes TaxID=548 RepID=UPI000C21D7D3|nr:hypothetical protein [Klebsiella aerogenes]ATX88164.1 hypothetical protein AM345_15235 [Klebsiella aerogenes]EIV6644460.1 hypothetical protein [Klebsiella aerogenes]EJY9564369.1 hypothetical protein [Klebsiella aerogenes]ELA0418713.1 hypothetical protein [Klebsiella aerogenes]ELI7170355.1 hypothetical protein [Klebsiella aerogenes]
MNFHVHLARQLMFLKRSCEAYDSGATDEAIRMATIIRVLVHNTKASTSLLKHLNATTINLLSTTEDVSPNAVMYFGLGTMQLGNSGCKYFASLDFCPIKKLVPVSRWWNQIVFVLEPQTQLTRKKIVLSAANQDGGAHVDAKLSKEYEALSTEGAIGHFVYTQQEKSVQQPITEAHFVAIRQMAYEILNSPELNALLPTS